MKGMKRKAGQDWSPRRHGHEAAAAYWDPLSRGDHPPAKHPLNRTWRRPTLFGQTTQDVFKSKKEVGRLGCMQSRKECSLGKCGESDHLVAFPGGRPGTLAPSQLQGVNQEEETEGRKRREDSLRGRPVHQSKRRQRTHRPGGWSPLESTAIQCKNNPDHRNDRTILEKHFSNIAQGQRRFTRNSRQQPGVHCSDHASAALSRKKGRGWHKDRTVFWQKKEISPNRKPFSLEEKKPSDSEGSQSPEEAPFQHCPLSKAIVRPAAGSLPSQSCPEEKPSLEKIPQFEGDPLDSGSEGLGSPMSTLSTLIGTVAESSEEKYRVLEQRDQIMRQTPVSRTDGAKSRPFVGTCPDMCPEKERYMRESQKKHFVFEVFPGTEQLNHVAAVKEYRPSSADQEGALPHEVRPAAVLSRTMDYLMTQIMDQKVGSLREWYDFLWDRTRGIRKDMALQSLCDPLAASLMEKCTRFHIHCAHFMCEEPMSSFDANLNEQSMTACLHRLKTMYQDLRNQGVFCAREAEFQGYRVLLKLNKGDDILREVQQFHPDVRNSPEVGFALQAFAAFHSHNFVRFFHLVQSASYLNACLLHRYFSQMRKDALRALNVAYTVNRWRPTLFPLDGAVRMLFFRDCQEATDFLNDHGLAVADGRVELSQLAFREPKGLSKARKSESIARKLMVSIGEMVNGGPLSSVPGHSPVCSSFNAQNKYIGECLAVELSVSTQRSGVDIAGSGRGEEWGTKLLQPELPPLMPVPVDSGVDLMQVVDELVEEALQGDCQEVSRAGEAYVAAALCVSKAPVEDLIRAANTGILRQVAAEAVAMERQRREEEKRQSLEEERLKQEKDLVLSQWSQGLAAELTEVLVKEYVWETCSQELRSAVEADQSVRLTSCCEDVCAHLVDLFLADDIFETAKETIQEVQCFCKYLQRWREAAAAGKKRRRQMRAFPAAPCHVDVSDVLRALVPRAECPVAEENLARGLVELGHAGKVGVRCTRLRRLRNQMAHQMRVQHLHQQLLSHAAWAPLDLPSFVAQHLPSKKDTLFWKLVLVLPEGEEQTGRILANWLKVKFTGDQSLAADTQSHAGDIQTLRVFSALRSRGDRAVSVNVCIKVAHGTLRDGALDAVQTRKELWGASGLMLLLPAQGKSEDVAGEDLDWPSAWLQLKQLLGAKPLQPALPLVVLVPSSRGQTIGKEVQGGLRLEDLVSAKWISEFMVIEIPDSIHDLQGTLKVSGAVQWLIARCPQVLDLCCKTLIQYVEDGIGHEFSGRYFHDRRLRRLGGLASQEPSTIIEFFNSVLQFLASVLSSDQLCDLSWPVAEFAEAGGTRLLPHLSWNSPEHLAWLKQAVLGFQLPQMDLLPPGAPWLPMCSMIIHYASQIPSSSHTQPVLQSQVEDLLGRTYQVWKSKNSSPGHGSEGPSVAEIPWDDIITLCINHKLRDWTTPRLPISSEALSEDGQIHVYFFQGHLNTYEVPLSWQKARVQTQRELQQTQGRLGRKSFHPSASNVPTPLLHGHHEGQNNAEHGREGSLGAEEPVPGASAQEFLVQCLANCLLAEKEENKKFEDQLQRWLSEDSQASRESTYLPLSLPQTLVSLPDPIQTQTTGKASTTASPQNASTAENGGRSQLSKRSDMSLTARLEHLQRLIQSSREEEAACELHLSVLQDMVDI